MGRVHGGIRRGWVPDQGQHLPRDHRPRGTVIDPPLPPSPLSLFFLPLFPRWRATVRRHTLAHSPTHSLTHPPTHPLTPAARGPRPQLPCSGRRLVVVLLCLFDVKNRPRSTIPAGLIVDIIVQQRLLVLFFSPYYQAHLTRLFQNSIPVFASMALVIAWKTVVEASPCWFTFRQRHFCIGTLDSADPWVCSHLYARSRAHYLAALPILAARVFRWRSTRPVFAAVTRFGKVPAALCNCIGRSSGRSTLSESETPVRQ